MKLEIVVAGEKFPGVVGELSLVVDLARGGGIEADGLEYHGENEDQTQHRFNHMAFLSPEFYRIILECNKLAIITFIASFI